MSTKATTESRSVGLAARLWEKTSDCTCAVSLLGGAPIFLGTPPYPVEVYNDLDSVVLFFFGCLRRRGRLAQLKELLEDHSDLEDRYLLSLYRNGDLSRAIRVSAWYACGVALLDTQLEKFQRKKLFNREGGDYELFGRKVAGTLYQQLREIDPKLPDFHGRLFRMQLEHYPVNKVVQIYDSPETVFVVDDDQYDALDQDVDEVWDALTGIQGSIFTFDIENASSAFHERRPV